MNELNLELIENANRRNYPKIQEALDYFKEQRVAPIEIMVDYQELLKLLGGQPPVVSKAEPVKEDLGIPQTVNIALRLMTAGKIGLLTAEIFRGLHCSKYTSRLSDLRKQGHQIKATKEVTLAGGISTDQWRYVYQGFAGKAESLHSVLKEALREWEHLTQLQ